MRDILAAEAQGDDAARLAIEVFVHRIVLAVGAYFTLLEERGACSRRAKIHQTVTIR